MGADTPADAGATWGWAGDTAARSPADAVVTTDGEGVIHEVEGDVEGLVGVSGAGLTGRRLEELVDAGHRAEYREVLAAALAGVSRREWLAWLTPPSSPPVPAVVSASPDGASVRWVLRAPDLVRRLHAARAEKQEGSTEDHERRRQELATARLRVREEEARRIARDLHDEAGQLLVGLHLALDEFAGEVRPEARERLRGLRGLLDRAQEELRRISHEMRPLVLDDLGLEAALQSLAEGVAARSGLPVRVTGSTNGRLPALVESALYRIVQEALNNAVKHAGATKLHVHLSPGHGTIRCSVRDDGRGFDLEEATSRAARGLGLLGMQERLDAVGGTLRVQSHAGFGTEILVSVPLTPTEEAPFRPRF